MWSQLARDFEQQLGTAIHSLYGTEVEIPILLPPSRDLGDFASPVALSLARQLRQSPRSIAEAICESVQTSLTQGHLEVAGAGYLNLFLNRSQVFASLGNQLQLETAESRRIIVEHTNINPNKAAHIGHLRNAVLGDILGRLLRSVGHDVEIENYIDDTGVQVADVVVGFLDIRHMSAAEIEAIPEPFDFYCWDLYAQVGDWFAEDLSREQLRRDTLHQLESGSGPRADVGRLVAERVLARHLTTMRRLGVDYDLLTRESDILALDFFAVAFQRLKDAGAIHLEPEGKNKGCWVMPLAESEEFQGLEDPDKVIVRSDGTITYVGKDIAYQMWKFGVLGRDFQYRRWAKQGIWRTDHTEDSATNAGEHKFGAGEHVINVIDARQSYLQKIVRAGLEALGHHQEAQESFHFAYEMVSLSTATALSMGVSSDGGSVEMSGRKGIGVKADDLLDQLTEKSLQELASRESSLDGRQQSELAHQIAVAALRFFMAKATTTRVIAFYQDEALAFEGETGPYLQYSVVRARNIRRKLLAAGIIEPSAEALAQIPARVWNQHDDLWDLIVTVARIPSVVADTAKPPYEISLVARLALELAQKFNAAYHRHPVLQESDDNLRNLRIGAFQYFETGMEILSSLLGIDLPEQM